MGLTEEDTLMLTHVNKADSYFLNVRMDFDFHITIYHFVFCVVFCVLIQIKWEII